LSESGDIFFEVEFDRIKNVVLKIAKGIIKYEYSEALIGEPIVVNISPFPAMSAIQIDNFNSPTEQSLFPEIGSRAFVKMLRNFKEGKDSWTEVQEGKFRYMCILSGNITVKFVIQEYLACEVSWN